MSFDCNSSIREAEQLTAARQQAREEADAETRQKLALETIADELTQIRVEIRMLRTVLVEFATRAMQTKM